MIKEPIWRLTALRQKLWSLDAGAIFPLGLWFFRWSRRTFTAAMAGITLLAILDGLGLAPGRRFV
jgi:hypothetical protein